MRATRVGPVRSALVLSLRVSDRQIRAARTSADLPTWVRETLPLAVELYYRGRDDPNPKLRLVPEFFRHLVPDDRPPAEGSV